MINSIVFSTSSVWYLSMILLLNLLFSPEVLIWKLYAATRTTSVKLCGLWGNAGHPESPSFSSCRDHVSALWCGSNETMPRAACLPCFFYWSVACLVDTNTFCQRNVKRVGSVPFGDQAPSGHPGDLEVSPASPLCKWLPPLPPGVNLREKEGLAQWISNNSRTHGLFSSYLPPFLLVSFLSF